MDLRLVEFTSLLRHNGVRVSVAESIDAFRAAAAVGVGDREVFRAALRAALVKRPVDIGVFDALFDLYFSGRAGELARLDEQLRAKLGVSREDLGDLLAVLAQVVREMGAELSPLARALLVLDGSELERLLAKAMGQLGPFDNASWERRYVAALSAALGLERLEAELGTVVERLRVAGPQLADLAARYIEVRRRQLGEALQAAVRREMAKHDVRRHTGDELDALAEKSFYYLSEEEIRRMRDAVTRLAQRLKNVISVRRKHARRGKLNLRATLRSNLECGGVPFRLELERRRRQRPRVMVLCDISDSVRNVSRFMLQFVYSLQDLYAKVRSFIFVSEIAEVTRHFEENDIHTAIDEALRGRHINVAAHSDFGRAFRTFHRDYLGAVNRQTTVIILGDARNNYNLPHDWALADIRTRAKQVIWLNPESRATWGYGDSEMERYAPHCTVVEECRNLNQLYRVIDRLVSP